MIYNNLLYFLAAIFLFGTASVPTETGLAWWQAGAFLVMLFFSFDRIASRMYRRPMALRTSGYFSVERRVSLLAILFFAAAIYLFDLKYYLSWMALGGKIPALINVGGLAVFLLFLSLMWKNACRNYGSVFGRHHTQIRFVLANIKANLPIVIPWLVISLFYDVVTHIPSPAVRGFLQTEWGDLLFLLFFLFFVVMFFPPLVRRLWGCKKVPEGPLRDHLVEFCAKQNFATEFYYWPLFEGRVITAGVMGVLPWFRYILITPALVEHMSPDELDAVMAHEIGHVKKRHLLLYVFLIGGFSILAGFLTKPLYYYTLSQEMLYAFVDRMNVSLDSVLNFVIGLLILILALLYFRFVFGFFMRNFERQADLSVFSAIGDSNSLVAAFEKIAVLSGNTRDESSWHHFGIGQRVDYLEKCEQNRSWITHQDRKVRWSLIAYLVFIACTVMALKQVPVENLRLTAALQTSDAIVKYQIEGDQDGAMWLLGKGTQMLHEKEEELALTYFEKALVLAPSNPQILNTIAWLLLTSEKLDLRDPSRALSLARTAVMVAPLGHILDTLATAYWANGLVDEAVKTERQAIQSDPSSKTYYEVQAKRFAEVTYQESYNDPVPEEVQAYSRITSEEDKG